MREFAFTVDYEQGTDFLMDVFIEYPDTHARMVACHITPGAMWRLDRIAGPTEALDKLVTMFTDPTCCNECISGKHCHTDWEYEILSRDTKRATIYTFRPAGDCISIPRMVACIVGGGVLYEAERRGNTYEWRLLVQNDAAIGDVYESLDGDLRDGLSLSFGQVNGPSRWIDELVSTAELPSEQRTAIEAAVNHGYYETPRNISLAELAKELELPRSTLQYRLQRAESRLIQGFVNDDAQNE